MDLLSQYLGGINKGRQPVCYCVVQIGNSLSFMITINTVIKKTIIFEANLHLACIQLNDAAATIIAGLIMAHSMPKALSIINGHGMQAEFSPVSKPLAYDPSIADRG